VNKGSQPADTIVNSENTAIEDVQHASTLFGPSEAISLTPDTLTLHLASATAAIFDLK
jgi:hypothetical protein